MNESLNALVLGHHVAAWTGFAAFLIALFERDLRRSRAIKIAPLPIMRDWLATGRINAVVDAKVMGGADDVKGEFSPFVEENRVENVSGLPNVEIRWRHHTRQEVREIVRRYHDNIELHPHLEEMTRMAFESKAPLRVVEAAE